ncbi:unnamed protein product [Leptosia nina]|uniref:Uncharacterized protein n=1 Tax=Leptosia nina TaxID=320188 RepID=A0AAV1JFQ1_9NEOP
MVSENEVRQKQEASSALREGQSCSIVTYEKSTLDAKFTAWNPDGSEVIVQELKTPAKLQMESAILRTPDILAMIFTAKS